MLEALAMTWSPLMEGPVSESELRSELPLLLSPTFVDRGPSKLPNGLA
jgi:hypothetical protein